MPYHLIFAIATMLTILIYLSSIGYLMKYLRRVYTALWVDLGEPTLPGTFSKKRTPANPFGYLKDGGFGIIRFVFSNQYKNVDDPKLANLIWVVRASFVASGILIAIQFAL
jgi:hypothetical protein